MVFFHSNQFTELEAASSSTSEQQGRFHQILSNIEPTPGTPLARLVKIFQHGLADDAGNALKRERSPRIPHLTRSCRKKLHTSLNKEIPLATTTVKPWDWLFAILRSSMGEKWKYRNTYLNGSDLPMTANWWSRYLDNWNIDSPDLKKELLQAVTPKTKEKFNLDALIQVDIGEDPATKEEFESAVLNALHSLVSDKISFQEMAAAVKGPTRIRDIGTIFTIGTEETSFDLLAWYLPPEQGIPHLFTQQAISLCINALITQQFEKWSTQITPKLNEVDEATFLLDRCINAVRLNELTLQGNFKNYGIFKKLMIMKAKGCLGLQPTTEKLTYEVYEQYRNTSYDCAYDAWQSWKEHLPNSCSARLVQCLHWMAATYELREAAPRGIDFNISDRVKEYWLALRGRLDIPETGEQAEVQSRIFEFLQDHLYEFPVLLTTLELVMLSETLTPLSGRVSFGIWDGALSTRLRLDETQTIFFQRAYHPQKSLKNFILYLEGSSANESIQKALNCAQQIFAVLRKTEVCQVNSPPLSFDGNALERFGLDPKWVAKRLKQLEKYRDLPLAAAVFEVLSNALAPPNEQFPPDNSKNEQVYNKANTDKKVITIQRQRASTAKKTKPPQKQIKEKRTKKRAVKTSAPPKNTSYLQRLAANGNFVEIWKALDEKLKLIPSLDPDMENAIRQLLNRAVNGNPSPKELQERSRHLNSIIGNLDKLVQWEKELATPLALTPLVIHNLFEVAHRKNTDLRKKSFTQANRILDQITPGGLNECSLKTYESLVVQLRTQSFQPTVIPKRTTGSRRKIYLLKAYLVFGTLMGIVLYAFYQYLVTKATEASTGCSCDCACDCCG